MQFLHNIFNAKSKRFLSVGKVRFLSVGKVMFFSQLKKHKVFFRCQMFSSKVSSLMVNNTVFFNRVLISIWMFFCATKVFNECHSVLGQLRFKHLILVFVAVVTNNL